MHRQSLSVSTAVSSTAKTIWAALLNSWRALTIVDSNTYRPEAYYMRGPGPKWREKHQSRA
jgi:hypothetical protein